jgi:hypothetical protein
LEFCIWVENFNRQLSINGIPFDEEWVSNMTLETSPMVSATYDFWRNESSVFVASTNWLFMQNSAFYYSCMLFNPNPNCITDLRMPDMNTVSGMSVIQQCTMLVKIPAEI